MDEGTTRFDDDLGAAAELIPASFATFRASIEPAWIEEALLATGTSTVRRRRLPAEQVIWLVLGIGLMRNTPIAEIVRRLDLALPDAEGNRTVGRARSRKHECDSVPSRSSGCSIERRTSGGRRARYFGGVSSRW